MHQIATAKNALWTKKTVGGWNFVRPQLEAKSHDNNQGVLIKGNGAVGHVEGMYAGVSSGEKNQKSTRNSIKGVGWGNRSPERTPLPKRAWLAR